MSDLLTLQQSKQLAQLKPTNTNAQTLISKGQRQRLVALNLTVCNQTGSAATWDLYIDKNGTTFDTTTALFYNNSLAANTTALVEWDSGLPLEGRDTGSIGVKVGTANAITFTLNGIES